MFNYDSIDVPEVIDLIKLMNHENVIFVIIIIFLK